MAQAVHFKYSRGLLFPPLLRFHLFCRIIAELTAPPDGL
jgi:hypothetical protein